MISRRQYRNIIRMHIRYARMEKRTDSRLYYHSIERIRHMWLAR